MHWFSVTSANIAIRHILLKTTFFRLYFRCRHYGSIFNYFDVVGPKATELGEITQIKGHYAVQGHSRSLILVPIERPYTTSYW